MRVLQTRMPPTPFALSSRWEAISIPMYRIGSRNVEKWNVEAEGVLPDAPKARKYHFSCGDPGHLLLLGVCFVIDKLPIMHYHIVP